MSWQQAAPGNCRASATANRLRQNASFLRRLALPVFRTLGYSREPPAAIPTDLRNYKAAPLQSLALPTPSPNSQSARETGMPGNRSDHLNRSLRRSAADPAVDTGNVNAPRHDLHPRTGADIRSLEGYCLIQRGWT